MTNCQKCWWYDKPIECHANFNIDTKECKNFEPKQKPPNREKQRLSGEHREVRGEDLGNLNTVERRTNKKE